MRLGDIDKDERKDAARKLIEDFSTQAHVELWVRTRRHLHTFSPTNQLLILLQAMETGERLDGIQAAWRWREAGYHPMRGGKALWVWAPQRRKSDRDDGWTCGAKGCGAFVPRGTGSCPNGHGRSNVFRLKPVFGPSNVVSFEDGTHPPEAPAPAPLKGDSHAHLIQPFTEWALQSDQLHVTEIGFEPNDTLADGAKGYWVPSTGRIWVDPGQSLNSQLATVVHETAHAHGIDYHAYERGHAEAIVETAASMACAVVGLDTTPRSAPYVAAWGGEKGEPAHQVIKHYLARIDGVARLLTQGLTATAEAPQTAIAS